jgi:hypothetical protein
MKSLSSVEVQCSYTSLNWECGMVFAAVSCRQEWKLSLADRLFANHKR